MLRLRLVGLIGCLALALTVLAAPAWAHPGHEAADVPLAGDTQGSHTVPTAALIAGALAFLAALPQRRRTLALALALSLAALSLEGVLHAALHLQHVRHAQSLSIGASPALRVAPRAEASLPSATPVVRLMPVAERYEPPAPDIFVASSRGRAPPLPAA
jgi:hypothetical protein